VPNQGSALNQVNVTTVQPTGTYEESMRGGMVKAWEKTTEPLPIPLPKPTIDAASAVGGLPKGFVAVMASLAREQSSAGR
jgi:hypothetical protein